MNFILILFFVSPNHHCATTEVPNQPWSWPSSNWWKGFDSGTGTWFLSMSNSWNQIVDVHVFPFLFSCFSILGVSKQMISGTQDVAGGSITQNPQLFEVTIWSCDRICDAFTSSMQHVTFRHMISRFWWWEYHRPLLLDFFPQFCNHTKYLDISTFSWIFWISHESCISSVWFSTIQMVVLRLKVFWCELSTTGIGISSESSANDLKQVLVTSELWNASSYGTKTTFPSNGTGPTGPSCLQKPWQIPCQAAVTVLLEPKRKDFLEMMVTCPESDPVSGGGLFRNCELGVPAWSQLFFRVLSFVVRENQ